MEDLLNLLKFSTLEILKQSKHLRQSPPVYNANPRTFDVRGDEAEDVVVAHEDGLVDLGLPEPRRLVHRVEHLDGDAVP